MQGQNREATHPPPALPGYEHINRYWDRVNERWAAKILPGEYYVSMRGELITTVLGSCVSACVRDSRLGIGGMNHFMLPSRDRTDHSDPITARYGSFAMETLINDILKNGGRRRNLEVKIFGGGQILAHMTDIGAKNIHFVKEYLALEKITLNAEDVGGPHPRKVLYYPDEGRVRVKKLRSLHNDTIIEREKRYIDELEQQPTAGDIELF